MVMHKALNHSTMSCGKDAIDLHVELACWFVSKRMRVDSRTYHLVLWISDKTFSVLYDVVQPAIKLLIASETPIQRIESLCKCRST